MTVDEAKTKWCPYSNHAGGNRYDGNKGKNGCNCMADACAVWRWAKTKAKVTSSTDGYCGLATE